MGVTLLRCTRLTRDLVPRFTGVNRPTLWRIEICRSRKLAWHQYSWKSTPFPEIVNEMLDLTFTRFNSPLEWQFHAERNHCKKKKADSSRGLGLNDRERAKEHFISPSNLYDGFTDTVIATGGSVLNDCLWDMMCKKKEYLCCLNVHAASPVTCWAIIHCSISVSNLYASRKRHAAGFKKVAASVGCRSRYLFNVYCWTRPAMEREKQKRGSFYKIIHPDQRQYHFHFNVCNSDQNFCHQSLSKKERFNCDRLMYRWCQSSHHFNGC